MSQNTSIEWTDASWNPIRGCSRVSEGCRNCYAERVAVRFSGPGQPYEGLAIRASDGPHWTGELRLARNVLHDPQHWRQPKKIFVNSMSDLFHEKVPQEWIADIFDVMFRTPQHTYQILTKRPQRMLEVMKALPEFCGEQFSSEDAINLAFEVYNGWPLPNVWLGVSVEDQATADARIPLLLQTPAAVRWVSYEPALGAVNFRSIEGYKDYLYEWKTPGGITIPRALNWIVAGGESGPGARPAHPDWFRAVRDQCATAGVPFFFKQWGAWRPTTNAERVIPGNKLRGVGESLIVSVDGTTYSSLADAGFAKSWAVMIRAGKKAAGALLDGREHREFPVT